VAPTMSDPIVRAYVIGQTPRPDLTTDLRKRFPSARFAVVGVLDDLGEEQISAGSVGAYPLETRLRDGRRVVVDAGFVAPLLQRALDAHAGKDRVHLVLCAGPFSALTAPSAPSGRDGALVLPFDTAVARLAERGLRRLDVLVPFADQAEPARRKWTEAGYACRAHVLAERPDDVPLPSWVASRVGDGSAEAVVFDYVGYPSAELSDVAAEIELPVFDVGQLAFDALQEILDAD